MKLILLPAILIAALTFHTSCQAQTTIKNVGLVQLESAADWEKVANGVWKTELGDLSEETRLSQLAAAGPRLQSLNQRANLPLHETFLRIGYRLNTDGKLQVRIPTDSDEQIFGFGLQFDGTRKNGKILSLKVDHFAKGGGATHAPVPFFVSSKGYGIFFNTAKFIKVYNQLGNRKDSPNNPPEVDRNPLPDEKQPSRWLAQPPSDAVEAYIHGKGLELVGFVGVDIQDVVARYNLFCGGGAMPPLWGLGFWHRVPSKFNAEQTRQEISDFRKFDIPLDVIGLEPGWQTNSYPCTFEWEKKRFPDPAVFAKELLDDGLRLNLWENPYISKKARIYQDMYPLSGSHMVWLGIVPDLNMPDAQRIIVDQHKRDHFNIGVSGYKIDEVDGYDHWLWPDHATFPSGTSAEVMRQTYGLQWQQMLYKELFHKNNRRTYGLVRASNGGAAGYPFVIYSDSYGHDQYITGLSSASLCGILWCPEIRSASHEREWINRMHTVCFSPLAMLNAWASETKPWSYPKATSAVRRTIQLRMRLLPYLYTSFADYHQNGIPPVRSMLLENGAINGESLQPARNTIVEESPYGDGNAAKIVEDNSLFMFGPDILVAPFYNRSTERIVKLPPGNWYDFHTGRFVGNNKKITVTAEQTDDLPPLFVKEGSLIPMLKEPVNRTRDAVGAELEIRHYGNENAGCVLYEDDGISFGFEQGLYNLRSFTVERKIDGSFSFIESNLQQKTDPLYGRASYRPMTK